MTAKEILDIVNKYDYDEAAPLLETLLSNHLRGKVYLGIVNKRVEAIYFEREHYMRMMESYYKPQAIIDAYIERWGLDEIIKYLTNEDDKRK